MQFFSLTFSNASYHLFDIELCLSLVLQNHILKSFCFIFKINYLLVIGEILTIDYSVY